MTAPFATHNRQAKPPELTIRKWNGAGRVRAMLPAPLEESASTALAVRARKRVGIGIAVALTAAGVASCGGERQDANEQRQSEDRECPGSENHGDPGRFVQPEDCLLEKAFEQLQQ